MEEWEESEEYEPCYYCGLPGDQIEHVIPRVVLRSLNDFPELKARFTRGRKLIVPACRECNTLLGASLQKTLQERKAYLKERLRRRYKRLLAMPVWEEYELEEMGPHLRQNIEANIKKAELIRERLAW